MRVVFIGCVDFSYALLGKVMTLPKRALAQVRGAACGCQAAESFMILREINK